MDTLTIEPRFERPKAARPLLTRRRFLGAAGASLLAAGLYAGEIERHEISLERVRVPIRNLPEAFAGLRIVQISDIHFAEYTEPGFLARAVDYINRLRPDLVVMTGDFVSMSPMRHDFASEYIEPCVALLSRVSCPDRFAVLGNHDWMVNEPLVVETLGRHGIAALQNLHRPLERGGQRIWIAGIRDGMSGTADFDLAIPRHARRDGEPVILLAHEPDLLDVVAPRADVDLMLSGHTHGGQVRIPFAPPMFLPPLGHRYVAGSFRRGRTQLYVNRGIGAVGLPFRLNCPPELTELTLEPA